jgi:hypothetical protein
MIGSYLGDFVDPAAGTVHKEWEELDRLLVQLWTSRSVVPVIKLEESEEGDSFEELVRGLLPMLASRGAVNPAE